MCLICLVGTKYFKTVIILDVLLFVNASFLYGEYISFKSEVKKYEVSLRLIVKYII